MLSRGPHIRLESGQASVELVAVVPFVLLVGAIAWQLALGGTRRLARRSRRAGGGARRHRGRDVAPAARSALPRSLERDLEVRRLREGGVRVSVRVPLLLRTSGTARCGWPPRRRWGERSEAGGRRDRPGGRGAGRADPDARGGGPGAAAAARGRLCERAGRRRGRGGSAGAGRGWRSRGRGAKEALPGWSRARAQVSVSGGEVAVRLEPPSPLESLAERLEVKAEAAVEAP